MFEVTPRLRVQDLDAVVAECGNEKACVFRIEREMVDSAFDARELDGLHEDEWRLRELRKYECDGGDGYGTHATYSKEGPVRLRTPIARQSETRADRIPQ